MTRGIALLLTVLTGFSGLVYEVAWQRYLATLLGSHSEATAAVLGIFLGGLSFGYWLFGRLTRRAVTRARARGAEAKLLVGYGVLEAGIGAYVVVFPWLFVGVEWLAHRVPLGAPGVAFTVDVLLAALLIGPPSVLMGGTIPILTQGLSRSLDDATRFHAFVYGFNTAGAFVGALAAGFYLVPALGLVTVMWCMGAINLFAGAVFIALGLWRPPAVATQPDVAAAPAAVSGFGVYATAALLIGFAMMTLQTVVIRVAGLSFGSSHFTFSMVVAVFVLCIALGSLGVSLLSTVPRSLVTFNLWGLVGLFFLLYSWLPEAPYWVHALRTVFGDSGASFAVYYAVGFQLLLLVVGPAVVLSGAALPLLFHHLRSEVGELGGLAGTLYSWNTLGSLLGALLGGYALLFWLDLHEVYRVALVALLLAAVLVTVRVHSRRPIVALAVVPLVFAVAALAEWDPRVMTVGLFRDREAKPGTYLGFERFVEMHAGRFAAPVVFYEDDPTMTVSVKFGELADGRLSLSIATNGKVDGNSVGDFTTMAMAASVPAMMAERAERAFVIGWGTGITAGELASFDSIREVTVAEISRGVIRAAPLFDRVSHGASTDPKVRIVQSDAYRALLRSEGQYDLIVSEPSNPWVAGVEMLFTQEFLEAARERLAPGGVYCQWFHLYETDAATLNLVLRTYTEVFEQVAVWRSKGADLLLLGFEDANALTQYYRLAERSERPDYRASLERSGISSLGSLLAREVLPLGVVNAANWRGPLHTLYHPRLSHVAGRAFYRGDMAELPFLGYGEPARIGAQHSLFQQHLRARGGRLSDDEWQQIGLELCDDAAPGSVCLTFLARALVARGDVAPTATADTPAKQRETLDRLAMVTRLYRPTAATEWVSPGRATQDTENFVEYFHHGIPFDAEELLNTWANCRESAPSESECRRAVESQPQSAAISPESVEQQVRECLASPPLRGRACQEGTEHARKLLTSGPP